MNPKITICAILLLTITANATYGQTTGTPDNKPDLALQYLEKANQYAGQSAFDSALFNYEVAAKLFLETDNFSAHIDVKSKMGNTLKKLGDYGEAVSVLNEALELGEQHLEEADLVLADVLYNLGSTHEELSDLEMAQINCDRSLKIYVALNNDQPRIADCYECLGNVAYSLGDVEEALIKHTAALETRNAYYTEPHPDIANSYMNLGNIWYYKGDYEQVLQYYEQALEIYKVEFGEEHIRVGMVSTNIGSIWQIKGRLQKAIGHYSEALRIFRNILGENHPYLAIVYTNIGNVWQSQGNNLKAINFYENALQIKLENFGENHPNVAIDYNNLGVSWGNLGEYEKSLSNHQKALEIRLKNFDEDHLDVCITYDNLGNLYLQLDNLREARFYLEKSSKCFEISENQRRVAENYLSLGRVFQEEEKFETAIEYFEESNQIFMEIFGNEHPDVGLSFLSLAECYRVQNKFDQSLQFHQQALAVVNPETTIDSLYLNPPVDQYNHLLTSIDILISKGGTLEDLYHDEEGGVNSLEASLDAFMMVLDLMDKIRIGYYLEASREGFSRDYANVYAKACRVAYQLYDLTENKFFLQRCFEIAERSKAFILGQSLKEKALTSSFMLPADLLEAEESLKSDIAFYKDEIFQAQPLTEESDTAMLSQYQKKLFQLEQQYEGLVEQFESDYPKYYELKYKTNTLTTEQVQKRLQDDEVLIEYFWTDSVLYVFTIDPNDVRLIDVELNQQMISSIDSFINQFYDRSIADITPGQFEAYAHQIFKDVVKPGINHLNGAPRNLIIITDGSLSRLNFDLLISKVSENVASDWKSLSYLMKDYAIHYGYSASLLFDENNYKIKEAEKDLLAFSYGETDSISGGQMTMRNLRSSTSALPGSLKEIESIAAIMDGDYFFGTDASEYQFKSVAPNYQILHLAVHGESNDFQPDQSKLNFYSKGDSLEDGFLHAFELYNMELGADLAVLSACNTGTGKILKGEGVMSLGRAFSYAGVNSILLSHWEVSDNEAPAIMSTFYKELKEGKRKSEALRQSKLKFLENANRYEANPVFWGAFYVMGDDLPLTLKASPQIHYWILGIIGLVISIFVTRKFVIKN